MGKSARRSIKSDDPSSPPSSTPYIFYQHPTNRPETYQLWSPNDLISTKVASTYGEALSQIKNVENKTSSAEIPPAPSGVFTSSTSSSSGKPSTTTSSNSVPTQKPSTTTYKAFTSSYKSTTRSFNYNANRSDNSTDRIKMREEFFATYDVMTGIRIAATLGGFFLLMVFLIVYKSRSHSNKALRDPRIQARAAATVQEEEDREMQEAYEKTAFSLYQDEFDVPPMDLELHRERIVSLGNVSCPPYLLNPNLRFSSVGGYSSLLEPPRRYSDSGRNRRESNSDSSRILSAYHLNDNYSNQNENFFNESEGDEEAEDDFDQRFTTTTAEISYPHGLLAVPRSGDSRRSSGMTCCSTESSFLERRCSAITLGLSSLSHGPSSRRASRDMWEMDQGYPGIHIIEATPKSSPCPSERQTHYAGSASGCKDHIKMLDRFKRKRHDDNSIDSITEYPDENHHQYRSETRDQSENIVATSNNSNMTQSKTLVCSEQPVIRRAPLASLSSFKTSSIECQDSEDVFDESCADTDDDVDMEQFSTDSDEISLQSPPTTDQHTPTAPMNGKRNENIQKCDADNCGMSIFSPTDPCEITERQRSNDKLPTTHAKSYSAISSSTSDKKSNSSECVTINLVEYKSENVDKSPPKPSAPSSVILEMPTLAKQNEQITSDAPVTADPDPAISGTARKWSRETLF